MGHHPPGDDGFDDELSSSGADQELGGALDYLYADDQLDSRLAELPTAAVDGAARVPQHLGLPGYTVANPPQTVAVTALMDGRIQHIGLAPGVTKMTEVELAEEVLVIAELARQDGRSAQYTAMYDGLLEHGHDRAATRDFLSRSLDLPSPEDAAATRAHVFSTRYSGDSND